MHQIPMPVVLDPDRSRLRGQENAAGDDPSARADVLGTALRDATAYGQSLWQQIAVARQYLVDVLPDPEADSADGRVLTAPRGPADDAGWKAWIDAYACLTSALAGPAGDSGLGVHEATVEAQRRRGPRDASPRLAELVDSTTALRLQVAERNAAWSRPDLEAALAAVDPDDPDLAAAVEQGLRQSSEATASEEGSGGHDRRRRVLRVLAAGVGVVLAVRGLRPRRVRYVTTGPATHRR